MIGAIAMKWGVRWIFGMMNRKDLAGVMRWWAEDGVFEFPGNTPISGRYQGKQAIEAFFRQVFDRMETMHFTVKRVAVVHTFALGFSNTVLVEWVVDETSRDGISIHAEGITVSDTRRARTIVGRDYFFDTEPLERMWGRRESVEAAPAVAVS